MTWSLTLVSCVGRSRSRPPNTAVWSHHLLQTFLKIVHFTKSNPTLPNFQKVIVFWITHLTEISIVCCVTQTNNNYTIYTSHKSSPHCIEIFKHCILRFYNSLRCAVYMAQTTHYIVKVTQWRFYISKIYILYGPQIWYETQYIYSSGEERRQPTLLIWNWMYFFSSGETRR